MAQGLSTVVSALACVGYPFFVALTIKYYLILIRPDKIDEKKICDTKKGNQFDKFQM